MVKCFQALDLMVVQVQSFDFGYPYYLKHKAITFAMQDKLFLLEKQLLKVCLIFLTSFANLYMLPPPT